MAKITITNQKTKVSRTLRLGLDMKEICTQLVEIDKAIRQMQQAYLVRNKRGSLFLCVQEGAGSAYYPILQTARYDKGEGKAVTGIFRAPKGLRW